jgi:hypothetical protein
LAFEMLDDYRERGTVFIKVIIEDTPTNFAGQNPHPDADGILDWKDARNWAFHEDFDNDGLDDDDIEPGVIVLADVGDNSGCLGGLWSRFTHDCGSDIFCTLSCKVTPQVQVIDQGGVTVDDPCFWNGSNCGDCGFPESRVRATLDSILPAEWCGEATP